MPLFKKTLPEWIKLENLHLSELSLNENAIDLLKQNLNEVNWVNLAKNFNGFEIFKDNIDKLDTCWKTFCENTPEIKYLRQNIDSIGEYDLYSNQYVGNFICEWYSATKSNHPENKRLIAYYLLTQKNIYFHSVLNRYVHSEEELKDYLNCCSLGVLELFKIPCSNHLIDVCFPGIYDKTLNEQQLYHTQHCMDCYHIDSCMYCTNLKYIENVLIYVVLGKGGLIHQFDGNLKSFWNSISFNVVALPLIEKYLSKMDKRNLKALFEAISSKPHAISFLERYPDMINFQELSKNPFAIHIIKNNLDKISMKNLSQNPYIFEYDYHAMKVHFENTFGNELKSKHKICTLQ